MTITAFVAKLAWLSLFALMWMMAMDWMPSNNQNVIFLLIVMGGTAIVSTGAYAWAERIAHKEGQNLFISWNAQKTKEEEENE